MRQCFYFFANPYQPRSADAARALQCEMEKRGVAVYASAWLAGQGIGTEMDEQALPEDFRALVVFGGDGTLLRVAPLAARKGLPLFGVHTGTVGFLMPGDAQRPQETAWLLLQEKYPIERHPMLEISWENERLLALNDLTLTRGEHPGVIETTVLADGERLFTAHGDGAVLATPLGATAYFLAAGGPIVRPDSPCLVVAPICARELLLRPVIVPPDAKLSLLAHGDARRRLQLAVDGQRLFPIQTDLRVEVRRAAEQAQLITPCPHQFFRTLREKQLNWNSEEQE